MYRDFLVYGSKIGEDIINYAILFPLSFGISFVYLQANIFFTHNDERFGTMLFAGNVLIPMMVMAYKITFDLVFDMEKNRFINYQICILSPRLVIIQKILFAGLYTFFVTMLFFPASKLILDGSFYTDQASWVKVALIVLFGSLSTAAYHQFFAALITMDQIGMFWVRVNYVIMVLGGAFVPIKSIEDYSPLLGKLILINPLLYVTEGVRGALLNSDEFLSFTTCLIMLIVTTVIALFATWYVFKRRVDHI